MSDLSRRQNVPEDRHTVQRRGGCAAGHTDRALSSFARDPRAEGRVTKAGSRSDPIDQFPSGQTRLATYRNPVANASDGETADIPCWVRNVDGNTSRYSRSIARTWAVPCDGFRNRDCSCARAMAGFTTRTARAHPVRRSGACSNIAFKVLDGNLQIQAGEMPTPGLSAANKTLINITEKPPCA